MMTLCAATRRGRTTPRRASLTRASTTRSRPSGPRSQPLAARAAIGRPALGVARAVRRSWGILARPEGGALPTGSRGSGGHRRFPRLSRSTTRCACSAAGQGRGMARHLIGGDGALATSFPWRNRFVWPRMRAPSRPATEPALDQGLVPSPARPPTLHTCFVASPVSNETAGHRRPRAGLADPARHRRPGPGRLRLAEAEAGGLSDRDSHERRSPRGCRPWAFS